MLVRPRLNSAAHFLIVENKGDELQMISFGAKPFLTKNSITARYSILSILRDTDNTPASDSCIKQTT